MEEAMKHISQEDTMITPEAEKTPEENKAIDEETSPEVEVKEPETVETESVKTETEVKETAEAVKSDEEVLSLDGMLSEELKENKTLKNFKDVDSLAKSYLHLNQLLGKKFDDLSPEELDGFYTKLGRPQSKDEYKLVETESPEITDWYKGKAYELGLTQKQAGELLSEYHELEQIKIQEMKDQHAKTMEGWVEDIKAEFGGAFDKQVATAKKAVTKYGGEELIDYLNQTGLGNHPAMVKAFAKIGKDMSEHTMTEAEVESSFGTTPADAKNKIDLLKRDPEFMKAYKSVSHPGHKGAVAEMRSLYEIAYPST